MADTRLENQAGRELRIDEEERQAGRRTAELDEQQDVNQGMDTGTHSTTKHGVNWGRHYRSPMPKESKSGSGSSAEQKKKTP